MKRLKWKAVAMQTTQKCIEERHAGKTEFKRVRSTIGSYKKEGQGVLVTQLVWNVNSLACLN